jgi:O-methyltransferase involved in polyketide biosynthesis
VPQGAASAPVDFERETIGEALSRTSFDLSEPAFFAWLGVTVYLTAGAVRNTLQDIAKSMAPGGEIVFDFATPLDRDSPASAAREALSARVEAAGEPLRSAFVPEDLCAQMLASGFSRAEVVDAAVLNGRYFLGRQDGLQLRGGHLMHARS